MVVWQKRSYEGVVSYKMSRFRLKNLHVENSSGFLFFSGNLNAVFLETFTGKTDLRFGFSALKHRQKSVGFCVELVFRILPVYCICSPPFNKFISERLNFARHRFLVV